MTATARSPRATVRLCELFESICGESTRAGLPAVFVRLSGCNLECTWCDTRYALGRGTRVGLSGLVRTIRESRCALVVVTGGEPLLQPATPELCTALLDAGKHVQVETNGSLDVSALPAGVQIVMDQKPPSSGQTARMDADNPRRLRSGDNLKIVVADRDDFEWAAGWLAGAHLPPGVDVLLSPAAGRLDPRTLADWLLEAGLQARLQIQLHRLLWPTGSEGRPLTLPQEP